MRSGEGEGPTVLRGVETGVMLVMFPLLPGYWLQTFPLPTLSFKVCFKEMRTGRKDPRSEKMGRGVWGETKTKGKMQTTAEE